jgi:predicted Rossmann fold flavoprotein
MAYKMLNSPDVVIIGAGAAGLMCALTAAQRGRRVIVFERASKVGKKILISGGGRCNFTNLYVEPECYLSENSHFCKSALSRFTPWDFIHLLEKYGIAYHEKSLGQLFCDHSAKDIVNMLQEECRKVNVDILLGTEIACVEFSSKQFHVETNKGLFDADSLVVASGGLSIPKMGSSGYGLELARQFGLDVCATQAGLVPFTMTDQHKDLCQRLSGISLPVIASIGEQSFRENMLFTHRGLSGPVMLQLSNYWCSGAVVDINLLPDCDAKVLVKHFKKAHPKAVLRTLLIPYLPKKLVAELALLFWLERADVPLGEWPNEALYGIASVLNSWSLKPSGTEGYRVAEVMLGGVDTRNISSKTMECQDQPGLYFIGEVLDVTGQLGGFNFQWAWSSGFAAGQYV